MIGAAKSIIGLDVGSWAVKAVALQAGKNGRVTLQGYAQMPIGEEDQALIVRRVIDQLGVKPKQVVSSVSGRSVIVRQVEAPKLNDNELREHIGREVVAQIVGSLFGKVFQNGSPELDVVGVVRRREEAGRLVLAVEQLESRAEAVGRRRTVVDVGQLDRRAGHRIGGIQREATEDDGVWSADACASQHADDDFGNHAHVDRDAITLADAIGLER